MTKNNRIVISVQNVVTRFGDIFVHRGITFDVYAGTIVALIGGSGTGKSTLLREIVGLHRPTEGEVFLLGENVWKVSAVTLERLCKRFGMLFQDGALFSALNVAENIAVPLLEQTKITPELIETIVQLKLALTGLPADTAEKMPSELSGGMRKRVALARALVLEPEILFLDEPTSGLDPINARAFDKLVRTLSTSLGLTVFIVTHDLDTISGIADRVIVLDQGKVLADGSAKEVEKVNNPWIQAYFSSRVK